MTRKPLGILAADPFGPSMAGPARRSLELATHLAVDSEGATDEPDEFWPVELWYEGDSPSPVQNVTLRPFDLEAWLNASEGYYAAIIPSQFALKEHRVFDTTCVRVIDCTVPFPVETASILIGAPAEEQKQITRLQSWAINRAVSAGDYWLVSNDAQKHWLMGLLTSLGRMTPSMATDWDVHSRVITAPYGYTPLEQAPDPAPLTALLADLGLPPDTPYLLWTGGFWPWMDPLTLVDAMSAVVEDHPDLHLLLPGATSPQKNAPGAGIVAAVQSRIAELGIAANVHALPWISSAVWPAVASGALMHLSAHHPHPEADLSFRTRYLEALRYRRKLVIHGSDPLFDQLAKTGWASHNWYWGSQAFAEAIIRALDEVLNDPDEWLKTFKSHESELWNERWPPSGHLSWNFAIGWLKHGLRPPLTPHPDGPWTPDMAGNPAAVPPTPTLLDRAMNKLRRMTR